MAQEQARMNDWMVEDEVIAQDIADDGGAFILEFGHKPSLKETYSAINTTLQRHGGKWADILAILPLSASKGRRGIKYEVWYYKGAGGD